MDKIFNDRLLIFQLDAVAAAPVLMSKSKSDGQFPPPPYFIVGDDVFQSDPPIKQPLTNSASGGGDVAEPDMTEQKVPPPDESSSDEPANLPDILRRPPLMRYVAMESVFSLMCRIPILSTIEFKANLGSNIYTIF